MVETLQQFVPDYFELWHLPLVFLAGLIGEGYGTMVGSGGILIQFVLAALGMPLSSVVATDLAGSMGANVGVLVSSPRSIWRNPKLLIVLALPLLLGGIVGTLFLIYIPLGLLRYIIGAGLFILLVYLFLNKAKSTQVAEQIKLQRRTYPLLFAVLSILGVYGNVSGVGVGTFMRVVFISWFRLSFVDSLGIGNIIFLPAALFSLGVTAITGLIAWPYLLTLAIGTFLGGKYATKYIRKIPNVYLRRLLIGVASVYLVYLLVI